MTSLKNHAEECAVQHTRTSEDLGKWMVATSALSLELLLNLSDFVIDQWRVWVNATETAHCLASFFLTTHSVCETRRFRHGEDGSAKNDSPKGRESVWNSPLSGVAVGAFGTEVDLERLAVSKTLDHKCLTIYAVQIPIVMSNWYELTVAPLIFFGTLSLWYMGTEVLSAPMPKPAVNRPMANWTHCVLLVISITTPMI